VPGMRAVFVQAFPGLLWIQVWRDQPSLIGSREPLVAHPGFQPRLGLDLLLDLRERTVTKSVLAIGSVDPVLLDP
jgi:hypothetical protein